MAFGLAGFNGDCGMNHSLEISPAKHGGFVVKDGWTGYRDPGVIREALFAGTLADCLEFIGSIFEIERAFPGVERSDYE